MIDSIQKCWRTATYDFRVVANPDDPLSHLFEEWVDYYKLKWALAKVLQPTSIFEIGVRFGYSAFAFLDAAPQARYVGLDSDSDSFGGSRGAVDWARRANPGFNATFMLGDSQKMSRLPGGIYDLVHIDGQQDADGSFHDLSIALPQARHILLDGYFWTAENFQAASSFLMKFRDAIEYCLVIPGYAGELLIKVRPDCRRETSADSAGITSADIRSAYSRAYYLHDCGGYESYKRTRGKRLEDPRLLAVASIATLRDRQPILDLGCGRGELVRHFAESGSRVTGVDYSRDAIDLAEECFAGESKLRQRVELICGDVNTVPLQGTFGAAIASDLVERLSPAEAHHLYERVAGLLEPDGVLVVHTAPNLWCYRYGYRKQRRVARSAGAYLAPEPRTQHALLTHINEQSPRSMLKDLRRHFRHVLLWLADPLSPAGSLGRPVNVRYARTAPDIFAVASHSPLSADEFRAGLEMLPMGPVPHGITLALLDGPERASSRQPFRCTVEVRNESTRVLHSNGPNPVHISYHWLDEQTGMPVVYDGLRTRVSPALATGRKRTYSVDVFPPSVIGTFILRLTLVQELIRWFDEPPADAYVDARVQIV